MLDYDYDARLSLPSGSAPGLRSSSLSRSVPSPSNSGLSKIIAWIVPRWVHDEVDWQLTCRFPAWALPVSAGLAGVAANPFTAQWSPGPF